MNDWEVKLTLRPRIWLIAADSLSVHSSMTFCRISFMNNMKALRGFLTWDSDIAPRHVTDDDVDCDADDGDVATATGAATRLCVGCCWRDDADCWLQWRLLSMAGDDEWWWWWWWWWCFETNADGCLQQQTYHSSTRYNYKCVGKKVKNLKGRNLTVSHNMLQSQHPNTNLINNPGIENSIPRFGIEKFVILESQDPVSGLGLQRSLYWYFA